MRLGYELFATGGTANYLNKAGIPTNSVRKIEEASPNSLDLVAKGTIKLLVNTESNGSVMINTGFRLRRTCIEHGVPTITSLDTLVAVIECLERNISPVDLIPYELSMFAKIVSETRFQEFPQQETPPENAMLLK
jgi:carbamoyl-phosphate synthase large subunit